jgi:hypothetical protein
MEETKVVLINGPPLCGKDVAAEESRQVLYQWGYEPEVRQFKSVLFRLVRECYHITPIRFWEIYNNRDLKEEPLPDFNGLSVRQAMIFVSEEVIKPKFGKDFFGIAAASSLEEGEVNIFSDSGFIEETLPVIEKVGKENTLLIRVYGRGDFSNDSRDYLPFDCVNLCVDVYNTGTELEYLNNVNQTILSWLRRYDG